MSCKNPECKSNKNKSGLEFCQECKAFHFKKFQLQKKVTNYILHSKLNTQELYDQLFRGYNNKPKNISIQAFIRHVSLPYLKILFGFESNHQTRCMLEDSTKYTAYGTMVNRIYVVWLSFDMINHIFVPEHFVLQPKRKESEL